MPVHYSKAYGMESRLFESIHCPIGGKKRLNKNNYEKWFTLHVC